MTPAKCIKAPTGIGCCPFEGGGPVVIDLLFIVLLIVCVSSVYKLVLVCIALCLFEFCNHFEEEEKAGCFASIVLQLYC